MLRVQNTQQRVYTVGNPLSHRLPDGQRIYAEKRENQQAEQQQEKDFHAQRGKQLLYSVIAREGIHRRKRQHRQRQLPVCDEHGQPAREAIDRMQQVGYHQTFSVGSVAVTFFEAGHVPGGAAIYLQSKEGSVLYTGDYMLDRTILTPGLQLPDWVKPDVVILNGLHANHPTYRPKRTLLPILHTVQDHAASGTPLHIQVQQLMGSLMHYAEELKQDISERVAEWRSREKLVPPDTDFDWGGEMPNGYDCTNTMTLAEFEACLRPLLGEAYTFDDYSRANAAQDAGIIAPILDVLAKAAGKLGETPRIDAVILNGGMSRLYLIEDRLERFFGFRPIKSNDPDKAVARGAAVYHYYLKRNGLYLSSHQSFMRQTDAEQTQTVSAPELPVPTCGIRSTGSVLNAANELYILQQALRMLNGRGRKAATEQIRTSKRLIVSCSNPHDFAKGMIQLLKSSGAPVVLKNCLPLARKLSAFWTASEKQELRRICLDVLRTELTGWGVGGEAVSANIEAIYTLGTLGCAADCEKLTPLCDHPKYRSALLQAFGHTGVQAAWIYDEFLSDWENGSSLHNSLQALGLILHHAKTDSLPVEQIADDIMQLIETADCYDNELCIAIAALGFAAPHGSESVQNRALETLSKLPEWYEPQTIVHCSKAEAIARTLIQTGTVEAEEEQYLLGLLSEL